MFDLVVPSNRNVVTWTVMIGGYAQHGEANDALKLFPEMLQDAIQEWLIRESDSLKACIASTMLSLDWNIMLVWLIS
ncbi:pentatricopeptide repeat-containing protein At5g16860-like [Hibiscus syriacus]|uniref:pentatricopeptide repeat-containing protein At5g16860-like n=1 Tax=Hibiscus syriacus TaxID=106335 RepID=UPI001924B5AF|nr:pentatricopeptide repeat-containing protein At5g16860-like [Hibiscus syriacus]